MRTSPPRPSDPGRHYSGVLVTVPPGELDALIPKIEAIPGAEVRHRHDSSGRLVAVLESDGLEGQEEALLRIRAIPGVLYAALVVHHVDTEGAAS